MNERQRQQLCKDFLRTQRGMTLDAMQASHRMRERWGIAVDWHEFVDALEFMVGIESAQQVGIGPDRFTEYFIEPTA